MTESSVIQFLYTEAAYLDHRLFRQWLGLLTPDIVYQVPIPVQTATGQSLSSQAFFMDENYASIETKIRRLESGWAWAEMPPSRTRRVITNIRMAPDHDEWAVESYLLFYRFRGDASPEPSLITAERQDRLRFIDGEWRLSQRLVALDTTVLPMENLAVFL